MRRQAADGAPNFGQGQEVKEDDKGECAASDAQGEAEPRAMREDILFDGA